MNELKESQRVILLTLLVLPILSVLLTLLALLAQPLNLLTMNIIYESILYLLQYNKYTYN